MVLNCDKCAGNINAQLPSKPYDLELIISDKVFSGTNQLLYDSDGKHSVNLYGDHNLINGVAWPKLNVEKRRYRFRVLNASVSRPYALQLNNNATFHVIGSDAGLLKSPVATKYLRVGVAERYEIIIDFTNYAIGTELYLLNAIFSSVPMFCQSHLLVKFVVAFAADPAYPNPALPSQLKPTRPLSDFISDADLAIARNASIPPNRTFEFHRSNGIWKINGITWADISNRIVGQPGRNIIETWLLKNNGGGWFHPVHIHLVDFFVAHRLGSAGVYPWEFEASKDVVFLGEGDQIRVVARWGPHSGEYMFHCHNLVHEDTDMMVEFKVNKANGEGLPMTPASPGDVTLEDAMSRRSGVIGSMVVADSTYLLSVLRRGDYNVFYPDTQKSSGYVFDAAKPWITDFTTACKMGN